MTGHGPDPPERPSWTGERRVTVDLDDCRPIDLIRSWQTLDQAGAHEIEARVSASGEGCHVRAWFNSDDLDPAGVEVLRYQAGDHPRRVRMDRDHHVKPGQILFSRKPGGQAGPWHTDLWTAVDDLTGSSDRYGFGPWVS